MAYREHGRWEILDVLERIHRGESQRSVARSTGRCRPAVARYLALPKDVGWVPGESAPDEALGRDRLQRGPYPHPGDGAVCPRAGNRCALHPGRSQSRARAQGFKPPAGGR